jgi:uncharacterized protein (TIGR01370 family)
MQHLRRALGFVGALAASVSLGASPAPAPRLTGIDSWAAFYGAKAAPEALKGPDLLVLEPDHSWNPTTFRRPGQQILAYLSLGEVHKTRPYYPALVKAKALAGANPNWPDAMRLDPRSEAWRKLVLGAIAPDLIKRGYDGFFLDTLDVGAYLERERQYPGATVAMARLVSDLHARFPQALIVANGGLDLLPYAAGALSGVAVESVFTDYDFAGKQYRMRSPDGARARAKWLTETVKPYGLPLLVLEYVSPEELNSRKGVAGEVKAAGFVPFVSDIGLERLDLADESGL